MRPLPLLTLTIALWLLASSLPAQEVPKDETNKLLGAAKGQYYNLVTSGVKSFHCDVAPDWPGLFTSVAGNPLPEDNPTMKYLRSLKLTFTNDLTGSPDIQWSTGDSSLPVPTNTDQLKTSFQQMLSGFFQAWNPSLSGKLITANVKSMKAIPGGYLIDDSKATGLDEITVDKDFKVTHMNTVGDSEAAQMDVTFLPSPRGLLLTSLTAIYRAPPTAPPVNLTMSTTFEPVDGFLLPASLRIAVVNVAAFNMKFENCTTQRTGPTSTSPPE